MQQILDYIHRTYDPLSIILYGSYADGSNNEGSDFDALVISGSHREFHDVSTLGDIQLDLFVYPASSFEGEADLEAFTQIFDGHVIFDTDGQGADLKARVLDYLKALPKKSGEEIRCEIEWCRKMLLRSRRADAEGLFRWHWVLTESLEIFCDCLDQPYRGPKKSLRWMAEAHPQAYAIYQNALSRLDGAALETWIQYLENLV